ncbi:hypothetical protein DFQ26_002292 [Actinomortierella ambigua]|nr:hypothetical protein DFQ26_002292 [Actinomortierella ambigua]
MPEDGDAAAGLMQQLVSELAQHNNALNDPLASNTNNDAANQPQQHQGALSPSGEPMEIDEPPQQQQLQQQQQQPNLLATLVSVIPSVGSLAAATSPTNTPTLDSATKSGSNASPSLTVSEASNSAKPSTTIASTSSGTDVKTSREESFSSSSTSTAEASSATITTSTPAAATAPTRSYSGKPFHPDDIFCLGCCRNLSIDHYTCPNTGRIFKSCHACRRKSRLNSKKAVKQKAVPVKECISVDEFCKRLKDIEALQSQETQTLDVMVHLDGPTDMDVESLKTRGSRIATYVYESTGYWFSHSRTNEETQSKTRLKIYGCSQRQDRKAPPAPKNHTKKRNRQSTKVYFDCKGSLTMTFHEGTNQVRIMYSHKSHAKYDNRKCPDHIRQFIKDNLNMMPKDIHDELKKREPDLTVTQAQVRYWSHYFKKNVDQDGDGSSDGGSVSGGGSGGGGGKNSVSSGSMATVGAIHSSVGGSSSGGGFKAVKTGGVATTSSTPSAVTTAATTTPPTAATAATATSVAGQAAVASSTVAMIGLTSSEHDAHSQLQRLAAQTQSDNGAVAGIVRDLTPPQATAAALLLSANGGLAHHTTTAPTSAHHHTHHHHHHHHHHHVEQLVASPITLSTSLTSSDVVATIPQSVFASSDVKELHSHLLSATMAAVAQQQRQHAGESGSSVSTSAGTATAAVAAAAAAAAVAAHDDEVVQEVNAILKETDVEQRIQQMLEEQRQEQERAGQKH